MKKILTLIAVATTILFLAPKVQAQTDYYDTSRIVGLPVSMPTQSSSNLTTTPIALNCNLPISFWAFIAGTNTGAGTTNTITLTYQLGYNGTSTNFATTPVLTQTVYASGTNQVVQLTQFGTNDLRGANLIRLYSIANANTNTISIGKVVYGQYRPAAAK